MLLLDVRSEIRPEREALLNEWYYTHLPRLASVPGYASARRYTALTEGPRYAALYEIEHERYVPLLVGDDHRRRHPLTLSEWERWDADLEPHMTHGSIHLYETLAPAHAPILHGDSPIVEARFAPPAGVDARAFAARLAEEALPALGLTDGVRAVTVLVASAHPQAAWLRTAPELLLLAECDGPATARELSAEGGELARRLDGAGAAAVQRIAYALIACNRPFFKVPIPESIVEGVDDHA